MESKDLHPNLLNLYSAYAGALPERVETIMGSGSNRQYVRFFSTDGTSLIGVHGTSYEENHAFITLARHFFEKGLPVPQVLAVSDDEMCYLNLSAESALLLPEDAAAQETVLLGLVRSLRSVEGVMAVQFLVDGEYSRTFGKVDISAPWTGE